MTQVESSSAGSDVAALSRAKPADDRLLLLAQEPGEVSLLSALTQSAVLRAAEVAYDRRARRLVLLLRRYRWEAGDRTRVESALRFESVTAVQRKSWPADAGEAETVLELLAFSFADGVFTASFGGGAALRIAVEVVDLVLEDMSGPWRASREPAYE